MDGLGELLEPLGDGIIEHVLTSKPQPRNREAHDDTMARVTIAKAPSNGSWWIGKPREGWQAACDAQLTRMRWTRFGQVIALNYAAEVTERRTSAPREFAS